MSERQKNLMLKMFTDNRNTLTTGDFLKCELSAEYRKIISLLRKDGYNIPKPKLNRDKPSLNKYILLPPEKPQNQLKTLIIHWQGAHQEDSNCPYCKKSWWTYNQKCTRCQKLRS